jgi:CO/xanthine dehydrogenase Mo-binding subunit
MHFREAGVEIHAAIEANSLITLWSHLRFGEWSSVVPQTVLLLLGKAEGLVALPQDVQVVNGDIGSTPDSRPPSADHTAFVPEQAVRHATLDARAQLVETAAPMLRVSPEELDVARGEVRSRRTPHKRVSVSEIAEEMHKRGQRCLGWGWQARTTQDVDPFTSQGEAYQTFGWTTQLAEVEVDTETGFVTVTRLVFASGGGTATAATGKTALLPFYLGPLDMPAIECLSTEASEPSESDGDGGASESVPVPTTSAILNAIFDAVGVRLTEESAIGEQLFRLPVGALTGCAPHHSIPGASARTSPTR